MKRYAGANAQGSGSLANVPAQSRPVVHVHTIGALLIEEIGDALARRAVALEAVVLLRVPAQPEDRNFVVVFAP